MWHNPYVCEQLKEEHRLIHMCVRVCVCVCVCVYIYIYITIIIIIIISTITVFAGVLSVHQPGANHAPGASVTQVNLPVQILSSIIVVVVVVVVIIIIIMCIYVLALSNRNCRRVILVFKRNFDFYAS